MCSSDLFPSHYRHSYPDVYELGHKIVSDVLNGHVLVQEKVDGSQISFGVDER